MTSLAAHARPRRTATAIATATRPPPAPDSHLVVAIGDAPGKPRGLIGVLLDLDLGARIRLEGDQRVVVEGRLRKEDVVNAISGYGCRVEGVEERPLSPRLRHVRQMAI